MRKRLPRCLTAFVVLLATTAVAEAQAQAPRRYQPARPTVSPYLNLFRNNTGPLPNYYSLVRPQINQQAFNTQVAAQQAQQTSALNLLESQSGQVAATPTGKSGWFMTYGRQSFMAAPPAGGRATANRGATSLRATPRR